MGRFLDDLGAWTVGIALASGLALSPIYLFGVWNKTILTRFGTYIGIAIVAGLIVNIAGKMITNRSMD